MCHNNRLLMTVLGVINFSLIQKHNSGILFLSLPLPHNQILYKMGRERGRSTSLKLANLFQMSGEVLLLSNRRCNENFEVFCLSSYSEPSSSRLFPARQLSYVAVTSVCTMLFTLMKTHFLSHMYM